MSEWGKRLDDLETPIEYYRVDAKNWDRCVVGEARDEYPDVILYDTTNSHPTDTVLYSLGIQFYWAVQDCDRSLACTIYHLIQKRVRLLCDAYACMHKRLGFAQC